MEFWSLSSSTASSKQDEFGRVVIDKNARVFRRKFPNSRWKALKNNAMNKTAMIYMHETLCDKLNYSNLFEKPEKDFLKVTEVNFYYKTL